MAAPLNWLSTKSTMRTLPLPAPIEPIARRVPLLLKDRPEPKPSYRCTFTFRFLPPVKPLPKVAACTVAP